MCKKSTSYVDYTVSNQWPGGFTGGVAITNTGATSIYGWSLQFSFPGNQLIASGWNGNFLQEGNQVTVTDAGYNSSITIGSSVSLGFNATWSINNLSPNLFSLNGVNCSVSPPPPPPPVSSCKISYTVPNQWPGGFTGSINIEDTATTPIYGWTLQFSFPGNQQITADWNGTFSQAGNQVTIADAGYNSVISPGAPVSLGFNGTWSGSNPSPTTFTLNGVPCTAATPPPPPPVSSCKVSYTVPNQWPGGYTGNITITNTGSAAISGWTLAFSFPAGQQIIGGWNGNFSQQSTQVTIANAGYNSVIVPAGRVDLGFNGSWNGSNPSPTAFTLNGVPCSAP